MTGRLDRAKHAADALWSLADLGGGTAPEVAAHAGLGLDATRSALRRLEAVGLVTSEPWAAGRHRPAARWSVR